MDKEENLKKELYLEINNKARDFITKNLESLFYAKYSDEKLLERCYKEIDILYDRSILFVFYLLYKYKDSSGTNNYKYYFRRAMSNFFVLYVLGISEINPLPKHYYCDKCKYICNSKVCSKCGKALEKDGYNLPYELANDSIIEIDICEPNGISLFFDFFEDKRELITIIPNSNSDFFENSSVCQCLLVPSSAEDLLCVFNKGIFKSVKSFRVDYDKFVIITIGNKNDFRNKKVSLNNVIPEELVDKYNPKTFEDYVKVRGLLSLSRSDENSNINDVITTYEDVYECLINHYINTSVSIDITNCISIINARGHKAKEDINWSNYVKAMRNNNCEDEFINFISNVRCLKFRGEIVGECLFVLDKFNYLIRKDGGKQWYRLS